MPSPPAEDDTEKNDAYHSGMPRLTRDAIPIEPLAPRREDTLPLAMRPSARWEVAALADDPDPDRPNAQVRADLAQGATALSLHFADSPLAGGRGLPAAEAALIAALGGVDPAATAIRIAPHAAGAASARWLAEWVERSGLAPERARLTLGLDPLSGDAAALAAALLALHAGGFRGALVPLDGCVVHEAGASEAQELAAIIAAAAWWLRTLDAAGLAPSAALPLFAATIVVDRDILLSIAKLRALRLVLARLAEECGAPVLVPVHATTSRRMLTRADPRTNILRNALAAFAAAVGGADALAVLPHDAALGGDDPAARRLAINVQHLLMDEAAAGAFADPAAGAGALEALTEALATAAWEAFREIERDGGILAGRDAFTARIAVARTALAAEVAGAAPLVGATIYRDEREALPRRPPNPSFTLPGLASFHLEPDAA